MVENILDSADTTTTFELREKHCLDFLNLVNHKIMLTSSDRKVVFANKSAEEWLGDRSSPLGNCRCFNIIHMTERPSAHCEKCTVYDGGISECSRIDIKKSNRSLKSVKAFPLKKTRKGLTHILYIFNASENEAESIRRVFDSKMLYVKSSLHDFNNLLMSILVNTESAKIVSGENSPVGNILDSCIIASRQSSILLNNLSSYLKDGSDISEKLSISQVCIKDLIEESEKLFIRGTKISFTCRSGTQNTTVKGDRAQLSRLFNNLLINAKDAVATGNRGAITVELASIRLEAGNQYMLEPGRYVKVNVADNGKGIEKDDLPHLFDPNFTTKKTGSGLGLYICSLILKSHNGAITAESTPANGTVFTVLLPEWPIN